jgi:DNA polymerase III delta subunit
MITLLVGENSFEVERALDEIQGGFDGNVEKIDGSELSLAQLPDILMGVSLFATARTVVIRNLSQNKAIWAVFGDWLPRISDDIHLILIEPKPDKRTTTFKALKENAIVKEFQPWTDRDTATAEKWAVDEAKKLGFELNKKSVQTLVQRVGVDQWQLFNALEKLSLTDTISVETITDIIEANPVENVFNLFETALRGDMKDLKQMLQILEQSEDVYRLSALLFTQAFQLATVASATKSDNVAKDFGIHPYVVSKLTPIAKRLGHSGTAKIIAIFAQADDDMKISRAEPWLLIERALMKIANL